MIGGQTNLRHYFALSSAMAVFLAGVTCRVAQAQQSREEVIAQQQAEKAQRLEPFEPNRVEALVTRITTSFAEAPAGLYPYLESVYSGGGFTLGAGYRSFYGDNTRWDVRGLYSFKQYKFIELATSSLGHASGRLDFELHTAFRDATQVSYYGLGMGTSVDAQSNFRMKQGYVGGSVRLRPVGPISLGAALDYEDYTLEDGQGSSPAIEDVYTPETAPGLGANPAFVHLQASSALDWRPAADYTRSGGYYGATVDGFRDLDETYSFERLEVDLVQHVPILRETWVVSLRGRVQTVLDDGDVVPYFLLPSLGSGSTLRGYSSWRFRDRHSLLTSVDLRWVPNRLGLDLALFFDAGKVTRRRSDLDFNGLTTDWGFGVRFHGPTVTPLRLDLAHGREGWNLVISGSAAF